MRVGLLYGLGPDASYDEALAQVVEADRLGLDSVLFEEHHGHRGTPAVAPLVCAAAARTSAIRVGAANRKLSLEYPVNTAEAYAVADIISRGRVVLGVSPGERGEDFHAAGVPWIEREGRFREAVELVRTVWTQGPVQFVGDHYRFPLSAEGEPGWRREPAPERYVDQWRRGQVVPQYLPVLPKPVQLPHPPIWVSGYRDETIEWAAQRGLSLLCSSLETDDEVAAKAARYGAALEAAGRSRNEVEVAVAREVFLAADADHAREVALPSLRRHVEAAKAEAADEQSHLAVFGDLDDAKLLETCALVGTPQDVLERLRDLAAASGMTHLVCRVWLPGRPHLEVLESIRLLASAVHTRLVA